MKKKIPKNPRFKIEEKSLKRGRVRRSDEEIKILKYRLKLVKLYKITYLPHIQEPTQEKNRVQYRGHGRIEKLKMGKNSKNLPKN